MSDNNNGKIEEEILAQHSTPGLRKNTLSRFAKKEHLDSQGMTKFPEDRDKILDLLYPEQEGDCK